MTSSIGFLWLYFANHTFLDFVPVGKKSLEFDFPSNGYNHAIWNKKLPSKNADFSNHMGEARVSLKILNQSILKYFIKFHASITKLSIGTKLEQRTPHYY